MSISEKNIIIGAGPGGIGAALSLGKDCVVLEKAKEIGGLSRSITIDGAVFDFGGHSFHTPHPEVKQLVHNALEIYEQTRNAKCFVDNEIIPYPFQKNFEKLSNQEIVASCKNGLTNNGLANEFENFEQFIIGKFGAGIAKHFMLPYNRKLWGRDLKRMAVDWTGERVAGPKGTKEKFDTTGGKRKPLQSDTKVGYPAKGGFGEIFVALGKQIQDIRFNQSVARVDPKSKKVFTARGDSFPYHNLISSIPIPDFLKMVEGVPNELIELSQKLDYLSMKLGLVVVNHPVDTDIQRFYAADETIPAHKIAINHNSSDYLRSLPTHGVMMEISTGPEKTLYRNDLENWIVESMVRMNIIKSPQEVKQVEVRDVKYSYPVPTKDRSEIVGRIKEWLAEHHIHLLGRFGEWAYINSDKALYRGLELGKTLAAQ